MEDNIPALLALPIALVLWILVMIIFLYNYLSTRDKNPVIRRACQDKPKNRGK